MKDMDFETQLRSIASGMEYPATPDIAGSVAGRLRAPRPRLMNRTLARSLVVVMVLLASLLLIPAGTGCRPGFYPDRYRTDLPL